MRFPALLLILFAPLLNGCGSFDANPDGTPKPPEQVAATVLNYSGTAVQTYANAAYLFTAGNHAATCNVVVVPYEIAADALYTLGDLANGSGEFAANTLTEWIEGYSDIPVRGKQLLQVALNTLRFVASSYLDDWLNGLPESAQRMRSLVRIVAPGIADQIKAAIEQAPYTCPAPARAGSGDIPEDPLQDFDLSAEDYVDPGSGRRVSLSAPIAVNGAA